MTKRVKLEILGLIVVVVAVVSVLAIWRKGKVHKQVITHDNNVVFNITTGELISRSEAYAQKAPCLGWRMVDSRDRPNSWSSLIGSGLDYTASLEVSNMDLEYAPSKESGKPLRNYWKDSDDKNWPEIPERKTSSYVWTVGPDKFNYPILFRTYDGTAGLLKITNVEGQRDIPLRYKIVKPAESDPLAASSGSTDDQFAVRLPDAARVEVVGVSYCPSADKPWWKPNGETLQRAPYLSQSRAFRESKPGRKAYEIAYRVTGAEGGKGGATFRPVDRVGLGMVTPQDEFGHDVRNISAEAISVDQDITSTTIAFGITPEPWQTILPTKEIEAEQEHDSKYISISTPEIVGGKIKIDFTLSWVWSSDYRTRFVAVDYSGKVHNLGKYDEDVTDLKPASLGRRRHTFMIDDLALSEIREFRFEVSRYQWVQFRNISLVPGKDFGFEIAVQGSEAENATATTEGSE